MTKDAGLSQEVRKAVKTFDTRTEDLDTPASVFAFQHNLGTADVVVSVYDRLGRPLKQIEVTVQDANTIVVKNSYDWTHGDKIIVVG
jgi:Ethanolamine utilization protein EutJ (predicted chaperonin)